MFVIYSSDYKQLMTTIDELNSKYGKNTLDIASQKLDSSWAIRQNNLSQNYTADFKDIIILNCNSHTF
ncbi:DUF4113 domain-containing protein [Kordia jejudonensis]|uniref:DUF4113 domain-containing protein n=1 Tax=Kordia jejudonensis TaxID=1348245 RepID=UPI000629468D|nr:DUF4113 domain-containing protein [Kordia jejudonensis]